MAQISVMDIEVGDRLSHEPDVEASKIEDYPNDARRIIHWSDGETTLINTQNPFRMAIVRTDSEICSDCLTGFDTHCRECEGCDCEGDCQN